LRSAFELGQEVSVGTRLQPFSLFIGFVLGGGAVYYLFAFAASKCECDFFFR
jgi:hypothetical protein